MNGKILLEEPELAALQNVSTSRNDFSLGAAKRKPSYGSDRAVLKRIYPEAKVRPKEGFVGLSGIDGMAQNTSSPAGDSPPGTNTDGLEAGPPPDTDPQGEFSFPWLQTLEQEAAWEVEWKAVLRRARNTFSTVAAKHTPFHAAIDEDGRLMGPWELELEGKEFARLKFEAFLDDIRRRGFISNRNSDSNGKKEWAEVRPEDQCDSGHFPDTGKVGNEFNPPNRKC